MRRRLVLLALTAGVCADLRAASLSCSLDGSAVGCYQQFQFSSDPTLSWLSGLGEATQGLHSGPWTTSNQAINVTLSSPNLLQRSDNTEFAWSGTQWTLPTTINPNISTFFGRFGAPDQPCLAGPPTCSYSTDPNYIGGQFGDDLVGVRGGSPLTINFATPVTSAGFLVSARTLLNFSATLQAYDSMGSLLGTYAIVATGLGGVCAGLADFSTGSPQPCTLDNAYYGPAPFIGFTALSPSIAKLVLQTNDSNGLFIDQMYFTEGVPEASSVVLVSGGLSLLVWLRRRRAESRVR